jgi:hypothetical protein
MAPAAMPVYYPQGAPMAMPAQAMPAYPQGAPMAMPAQAMPAYPQGAPMAMPMPASAAAPHQHKGLFARRHCVECQRAYVKAHDGVVVPPPPGYPGAPGMPVQGGMVVNGPGVVWDPHAPGYAVVGPGVVEEAPGYAVAGGGMPGAEPTPIGMARATQNPWADPRMAAVAPRPGAGPYDPSVVPSSLPPAQVAMSGPGHDRPHVVSHILGIPKLGRHWQERQDRRREQHASIAYGEKDQKVGELPASMVYGRR